MAYLENQLYVKKSMLPGAGNGLFTKVKILKGTRIAEYRGKLERWVDVKHEEENGTNLYLLRVNRIKAINAKTQLKTLARYANDAKGISKVKGKKNNCEFVADGNKCFIESLTTINRFEEILVGYGKEYWLLIRKLDRKKRSHTLQTQASKGFK
jgi:SET domain-containing protein